MWSTKKAKGNKGGWIVANRISLGTTLLMGLAMGMLPGIQAQTNVPVSNHVDSLWCECDICWPDRSTHNVAADQMCNSFMCDIADESAKTYRYRVNASSVAHNPQDFSKEHAYFIYDTGATVSVKRHQHGFNSDYKRVVDHPPVRVADGRMVKVRGLGSVTLTVNTNRGPKLVTIRNVLHCPDFDVDVLSRTELRKEKFGFMCELRLI